MVIKENIAVFPIMKGIPLEIKTKFFKVKVSDDYITIRDKKERIKYRVFGEMLLILYNDNFVLIEDDGYAFYNYQTEVRAKKIKEIKEIKGISPFIEDLLIEGFLEIEDLGKLFVAM